jgi:hypothetical protein
VALERPLDALSAIEAGRVPDMLTTGSQFPADHPTGVSLARMAVFKIPGLKVIVTGPPEVEKAIRGYAEFCQEPVYVPGLLATVGRLLDDG